MRPARLTLRGRGGRRISCSRGEDGDVAAADHGTVRSTILDPARSRPRRALVVLLTLAGAVLVGAGAKASASILGPALLAVVLTIALFPVARIAERRRWPTWVGAVMV